MSASVAVLAPTPTLMVSVGHRPDGGPEVTFQAGGQGFWVARIVAELGVNATLCAALGGRAGRLIALLVEDEGVTLRPCELHRSSPTWMSDGPDGDPATIASTPPPPLDRHEADQLYGLMLAEAIASGTAILTGVADEAVLPKGFYGRLCADLTANGVIVVADTSWSALWECAHGGATVVKVSREDLLGHGAVDGEDPHAVHAAVERLRDAGAQRVVVSCEEDPALVHDGVRLLEVSPPPLHEVNARGAGDAMTGALAATLARGAPFEEALPVAIAAGALNVTRRGLGTGERHSIELLAESVSVRPLT